MSDMEIGFLIGMVIGTIGGAAFVAICANGGRADERSARVFADYERGLRAQPEEAQRDDFDAWAVASRELGLDRDGRTTPDRRSA